MRIRYCTKQQLFTIKLTHSELESLEYECDDPEEMEFLPDIVNECVRARREARDILGGTVATARVIFDSLVETPPPQLQPVLATGSIDPFAGVRERMQTHRPDYNL
jgi:hypothetical protein